MWHEWLILEIWALQYIHEWYWPNLISFQKYMVKFLRFKCSQAHCHSFPKLHEELYWVKNIHWYKTQQTHYIGSLQILPWKSQEKCHDSQPLLDKVHRGLWTVMKSAITWKFFKFYQFLPSHSMVEAISQYSTIVSRKPVLMDAKVECILLGHISECQAQNFHLYIENDLQKWRSSAQIKHSLPSWLKGRRSISGF